MVSGVSFKNPNGKKSNTRRKNAVSGGIFFSFLFLIVVFVAYGVMYFLASQQTSKNETLNATLDSNQIQIDDALQGEPAAFIAKSRALANERYTDSTTSTILREFHQMIISGIVFESFEHSVDEQTKVASISLSANTISLDTLAAQIDVWKKSPLFSEVRTSGATEEENDDGGADLFTFEATFVLAPAAQGEQVDPVQ